jgi:uncharacterized protein YndB with AHSA1/START domain
VSTTSVSCTIKATPRAVYAALLDPYAVAQWKVPDGMTVEVHEFDAREGGYFRVSLTYDTPTDKGKTTAQTDTYHGSFVELVPGERVVERMEFETDTPELRGEMTMTTTLTATPDGTEVVIRHDGLPDGVPQPDNELGMRMALAKLAALVEARAPAGDDPRS